MSSPFLAAEAWQVLLISHFTPNTPEPSFLGPSSEGTAENWEDSEPVSGELADRSTGSHSAPQRPGRLKKVATRHWPPAQDPKGDSAAPGTELREALARP